MTTERQPAAQVAMARKAEALKQKNEERRQKQRRRPPESSGRDHKPRQQPQRRRQDNAARTEATDDGEGEDDGKPDSLVPDAVVARELGCSVMSLWRRTNNPDDDFCAPVKINGRNYRSRRALEAYKARKLREAMRVHHARLNVRRRVPLPV